MTANGPREETMMRYLLGTLPDEEQDRLEREFLRDDEAFEQLLALEDELRYEYAQGGLDTEARRLFEERYLRSAEGQRSLELPRALVGRLRRRSRRSAPVPLLLAAAAVLVLALGAVWMSLMGRPRATEQASREPSRPARSSASPMPAPPATVAAPERAPASGPASGAAVSIFSLAVAPGLVRDSGEIKRISLPPRAAILRLILEIPGTSAHPRYQALLRSAEGNEVWTGAFARPREPAAGGTLTVQVPARRLAEGDYELTLSGQTAAGREEVGEYYFRILREPR